MLQELSPGSLVAERFEVERLAGAGGMGAVYRALDRLTQQPVAIKVLFDGADKARFQREALLLAELQHPGIVGYISHGHIDGGSPFLAMQWLAGQDLAERLRHGGLTLKETLLLARRVAEALSVAHQRGVVHRDIKPSNLFLVDSDPAKVVLLDFGIARRGFGGRSAAMTRTGAIVGTPEYMAPEQARGQSQLSLSADVFSLGCVFHECLTGSPPFVAAHVAAVLAKILFEEAPLLRSLRPELPAPLEDLLRRMLHKDPTQRLSDGRAVLSELLILPELPTLLGPASEHAVLSPSIRAGEQQLVSVLLVSDSSEVSSLATMAQADDAAHKARLDTLRTLLGPSGLHLERLADGSLLGTLHQLGSGAATDLAGRAARAALLIHDRWGEAVIAIATGKGMLAGDLPVGEAVERAAVLLRQRTTGGGPHAVLLDELTAGLLDSRFEVARLHPHAFALIGERLSIDESRKLLGKPTPCVGREQELLALSAVLQTCIEESTPRVALVVAPAGVGKSRLRHEFLRRTAAGATPVTVLFGRGDAMNPGAPYGLWSAVVRGLCGRFDGASVEQAWTQLLELATRHVGDAEAARVAAFLAELAGLSPDVEKYPPLHAARLDGRLFFEQSTQAVSDFVRGACAEQPVLLVFEDLQWGDPQSLELTEVVLRALPDAPLMVLALARPEFESRLPKLGKDRGLQELYLGGLGKRAAERLVSQILGAKVPSQSVQRIVEQAAGNALYLEELIRAFAEGKTEQLPDTVLAMLQARIGRLSTEQRRVLRVASIFGGTFYRGGVQALLGHGSATGGIEHIDQVLRELTDAEIIERHRDSRHAGEIEYGIRHALLREAAYSLLTDDDRQLGHRLCAEFLLRVGEGDQAVLARHFELGADPVSAIKHYIDAASECFKRGGLAHATEQCLAAVRCGASGDSLGAVRCLQGQFELFGNRLAGAFTYSQEALALCTPGSRYYYWSLFGLLGAATLSGRMDVVMEIMRDFGGKLPERDAAWYFQEVASLIGQLCVYLAMRDKAQQTLDQMRAVCDLFRDDPQWPLYYACWQRGQSAFEMYLSDRPFLSQDLLVQSGQTYLRFGQRRMAAMVLLDIAVKSSPEDGDDQKFPPVGIGERKNERRSYATRSVAARMLSKFIERCDTEFMRIYGPYQPSPGRTRWRIQVYDQTTKRKRSLTAETAQGARDLAALVEEELRRAAPLLVHEAVEQYLEYKRGQIRSERHVQAIGKSLCQFLPNVPVRSVTRQQAEDCYLAATKRSGRNGQSAAAATHRQRLRLVKAFWAWLRKRELATDDPWSSVEPIGRVNTGKPQLGESEARKLDQYLFSQAKEGDEGALALLLALYLGLRTSEVLGLTVGAVDGTTVFVAGTKTKNARRKLALYEPVAKLLARHCAGRPATQRVFAANLPQQPKPDWAYKRLRKACQRLEIPQVCPHSLRGLHSSLALEAGATTHQVASALGHASFATTARHYAKRDSIEKGKAKRVVDVLHGSSPDPTVEQILARLPKDERRVLLSLIRA